MTFAPETLLCRGMRDLLPEDLARFRRLETAFRNVCAAWGYREVRTPTLEHLYLFTSSGTLSPELLGRVYSFLDWDGWTGERVVLRPDATIPVARLYRERLGGRVAKLCYVENVFRFSRDEQPREVWQCGAELIGDTWPAGDVEVVLLALDTLRAVGLESVELTLSHGGIVRTLLEQAGYAPGERAELYDRLLDGDGAVLRDLEARLPELGAGLHLLTEVKSAGVAFVDNLRAAFGAGVPAMRGPLDELELIGRTLELLGVQPRIDVAAVRDFEYYTGAVFHLAIGGREVGSGGRYDSLVDDRNGAAVPACGFALQVDRLAALLPPEGEPRPAPVRLAPAEAGPEALAAAAGAARALQRQGVPATLTSTEARATTIEAGADGALAITGSGGARAPLASLDAALQYLMGR
jgi:histidyl-tRNA synthetase